MSNLTAIGNPNPQMLPAGARRSGSGTTAQAGTAAAPDRKAAAPASKDAAPVSTAATQVGAASAAAQASAASAAALQAQISAERIALNNWDTGVSATTPQAKAEVQSISNQISAAGAQIQRLQASQSLARAASAAPAAVPAVDAWA
jgi:hypothetical protein